MDAKIMDLDALFETQVSYRIPQFQRPYAWRAQHWAPLWDDIRKVADRILGHEDDKGLVPHFMGAIVIQTPEYSQEPAYDEARQVLVVDGQQRLTTLQLLIKAMEKVFEASLIDANSVGDLSKFLLNDEKRIGNDYLNETKIRQSNRLDQAEFQEIIRGLTDESRPPRSIAEAYNFFQQEMASWISKDAGNIEARAAALYKAVTEYLKVATIILDTGEKPHFIFEILNTRGESLKEADHIKNTVMYEANVVDDAAKAAHLWGMFENDWWRREDGRGRDPQINLDRFLNYWIIMRIGENVPARRVAAEFRNYIETEKPEIEQVAEDVKKAGVIYRNIEENQQPGIGAFIKRVKTMEIGVIMPPLLWLYTHDISEEERQRSVRALESYLVRRMLCNMGSQGLNRLFIEMVKSLDNNKGNPADDVIVNFLKGQSVENRIWPDNRRVADYLTTRSMPGNAARKKMVFEAIEMYIRPKEAELLGDTVKLTVEHLLPQGWKEGEWPLPENTADRDEAEALRNSFIGLIGNLTLATRELNSRMSNRSWENKRKALSSYSSLFLNKKLLDEAPEVWDETAIEERSIEIARIAISIWPHASDI